MAQMNRNSLTTYIRDQRLAADMSQKELATRLGYSTAQFVSNWERQMAKPPLKAIAKMVHLLNLDKDKVMVLYEKETARTLRRAFKVRS